MATTFSKIFAAALLSGAVGFAGPSFAAHQTKHRAHHAKYSAQTEQMERKATAELNRAQLAGESQAQAMMTMPESVAMIEAEDFIIASAEDEE